MGKKDNSVPLIYDATTLRALADEADGSRHRTIFGHLDDAALLRALAQALRECADCHRTEQQQPAA
jgi:hypothetical protein